jgi:hypothetical protein
MDTLKSVSFDPRKITLKDSRVVSSIIPLRSADLGRDVVVSGACVIEGAVFAQNLEIRNGPLEVMGAVYA